MKKRTWAKFIITVLLIAAIAIGLYLRWSPVGRGSDPVARWGRGNLTISEGAYYSSRMNRIIHNWQDTRGYADFDKDGRFKESYRILLVIDLEKQAIWIEKDGKIQKNNYTEFPAGMKWKLHQSTPKENKELPSRIVLKKRGFNPSQQTPETFYLVGTGRGSGYMSFQLNGSGGEGGYHSDTFRLQPYSSSRKIENPYGSLLVTDAEYEQYRTGTNPKQPDGKNSIIQADVAFEENKANWLKSEKFIYSEIEKQLSYAGFELSWVTLEPGPDYSAGYAEIRGTNHSFLRGILGRSSSVEAYLKIDYLGNDIWYAKSAVHPRPPIHPRRRLDREFLICSQGGVPNSIQTEFIQKGRQKQQQHESIPETNWRTVLANGAIVEFIGIWENAGTGKQWRGPDGGSLGYTPYYACEPDAYFTRAKKFYEIAWRIHWPSSTEAVAVESMCEGCIGSYSRKLTDRYGNDLKENLVSSQGFAFEESLDKTNFAVWLPGQYEQRVIFKNISLIPGKNQGFEIE